MKKITIAGASGFIGTELIDTLKRTYSLKCLSRRVKESSCANVMWHQTDLYSLTDTIEALRDTDIAIYLVHSMLPASKLFQGNFQDTDLIIADNFIRACQINGVRKIIYLGGIVPNSQMSPHLESRKEVEEAIRHCGIDATIIRAGMVVGDRGSSFEILKNLCLNLPFMILPKWTKNNTQVIHVQDLLRIIRACLENKIENNKTLNAISGEDISYKGLLFQTKKFLGKPFFAIRVPVNYTAFSKLWVSIFGHANFSLVSPLVDSLTCNLENIPQSPEVKNYIKFGTYQSMLESLSLSTVRINLKRKTQEDKNVRSIQRLLYEHNLDIEAVAMYYFQWLPKHMKFLIKVESTDNRIKFKLGGVGIILLELEYIKCRISERRAKFHIVGGILTKTKDTGWLEFRSVDNGKYLFASINEFRPSLPWYFYCYTQAPIHKFVMNKFGDDLRKMKN